MRCKISTISQLCDSRRVIGAHRRPPAGQRHVHRFAAQLARHLVVRDDGLRCPATQTQAPPSTSLAVLPNAGRSSRGRSPHPAQQRSQCPFATQVLAVPRTRRICTTPPPPTPPAPLRRSPPSAPADRSSVYPLFPILAYSVADDAALQPCIAPTVIPAQAPSESGRRPAVIDSLAIIPSYTAHRHVRIRCCPTNMIRHEASNSPYSALSDSASIDSVGQLRLTRR